MNLSTFMVQVDDELHICMTNANTEIPNSVVQYFVQFQKAMFIYTQLVSYTSYLAIDISSELYKLATYIAI